MFNKLPGEGVTKELWEEMTSYAAQKEWKKGNYKKLNLPFENKILGQSEEVRERMTRRVEDFVYNMLANVLNTSDTAPLAIETILKSESHHVGNKAKRIEDPKQWTVSKIMERGAMISSDKGPEGDFDD